MFRKVYLKHKTPDANNLLMRRWHFYVTFDVTTMMAGKNQAALAVCAQTKVIFPFKHLYGERIKWWITVEVHDIKVGIHLNLMSTWWYTCTRGRGHSLIFVKGHSEWNWISGERYRTIGPLFYFWRNCLWVQHQMGPLVTIVTFDAPGRPCARKFPGWPGK